MKTNVDKLVKISCMGEVSHPVAGDSPYRISSDGSPVVLPGTGGITYNIRVGDFACGWEADHVEPGVSIKNKEKSEKPYSPNNALNILACVGNEAKVISGDAKGDRGVVTGKHGGIEHVLVDFKEETLEKLVIGDKVQVKSWGVGLKLKDFPEIKVMNMDPGFLEKIKLERDGNSLIVPVTHVIPGKIMGSGLGANNTYRGDYDIQLFDERIKKKYHLEDLRFGDLVLIENADHSFGRIYKGGAVSVGIVIHSDCVISGHGPGVTTLFTCSKKRIKPEIHEEANIAKILGLR